MSSDFADKIVVILAPLVGDFMAKMAVKSQCKALGISPQSIQIGDLEQLAKKIGQALEFHGKKDEADKIVGKIRKLR